MRVWAGGGTATATQRRGEPFDGQRQSGLGAQRIVEGRKLVVDRPHRAPQARVGDLRRIHREVDRALDRLRPHP